MKTATKVVLGILGGVVLVTVLLVGGCTALLWHAIDGDAAAGARRDTLRATHGALLARLRQVAGEGTDLLDAAARLRTEVLPAQVVGLSIERSDDTDDRVSVLRRVDGRQTSRVVINGAGTLGLVDAAGASRTFDLLQTDTALRDGTPATIELVLARESTGDGPE